MIEKNDKNQGAGPSAVPQPGDDGSAGLSRDAAKREHMTPGAGGTGQENEELEWARKHVKEEPPARKRARNVFRKTELHGMVRNREDAKRFRKQILQDLRAASDDEMVARFEVVLRTFIDTLIERMNLIEDNLLLHIAELVQRVEDLEHRLEENPGPSSSTPEVRT